MMLVFQKALKVDPQERPSVGLTLNLMSTDAQKFLEALPFLHKLWASPWHGASATESIALRLQIFLASVILLALVDVSALCGIAEPCFNRQLAVESGRIEEDIESLLRS